MNPMHNRTIVLDTETTGMNREGGPVHVGHRIIEVGAVEIINRRLTGRTWHGYFQPDQLVDPEAFAVHGISDEQLQDKPRFRERAAELLDFLGDAELVAHNAPFDVSFLDAELQAAGYATPLAQRCKITDTLALARQKFPGKRNNLDTLCERYGIDNSHRILHGALLDAEILADVYLLMTGGQGTLTLSQDEDNAAAGLQRVVRQQPLRVIQATPEEQRLHDERLAAIKAKAGQCLWLQ